MSDSNSVASSSLARLPSEPSSSGSSASESSSPDSSSLVLPPLVAILGPTAVGKTGLSTLLCQRFGAEVINADSRQVYRAMSIGTAKPTTRELASAPHHLIDIRNPNESLSLSEFQHLAFETIDELHRRQTLPLLIGGSALYIRSVVEGLKIPEVPPNPELRAELEAVADADGWEPLFHRLQSLDPATAAKIDRRNIRRVIRALEIVITTGQPKVVLEGKEPPPYRILLIGLDRPREELYERIDRRVDQMMADGLIDETQALLDAGYDVKLPAMSSLGYHEIIAYLQGELSLEQAVERIKTETHRFVRHQYTWFRRMENIQWFDMSEEPQEQIAQMIEEFLAPASVDV